MQCEEEGGKKKDAAQQKKRTHETREKQHKDAKHDGEEG